MFHKKIRQPLENTLKDLKGFNIKLGSYASFFYCGKCDKNIFDTINQIDNEYRKWYESSLKRAKHKYENIDTIYKPKYDKVKKQYSKNKKKLESAISKIDKAKEKDKKNLVKRIGSFHHYLLNWKPMLERNVIYVIDSINETNCKVIKIVGLEKGKFWTIKEYQDSKKPKKNEKKQSEITKRNHEIYTMAISGKYTIREIITKFGITYPTYAKVIKKERDKIREKYEKAHK